jgi:PEP-CTERM motif
MLRFYLTFMKSKSAHVTTTTFGTITAFASMAHAASVQITLIGNKISTTGGNMLNADITGDGLIDLTFSGANVGMAAAVVYVNGSKLLATVFPSGGTTGLKAKFAAGGLGVAMGINTGGNINYLNPITFTDLSINGGASTNAWLQVNSFNTSSTSHTVALTRVIFDDASTTRPSFASIPGTQTEWSAVPEPSGLALLALGAGGLLTRRKRQAA